MGLLERFTPPDDRTMSFWEHLEELRWVLIKCVIVLAVTTTLGLFFTDLVWNVLQGPIREVKDQVEFVFSTPLDAFLVKMKLGLLSGVIVAMPFLLWFSWSFVAPGLKRKERRAVHLGIGFGFAFFCLGVYFGYSLLPFGLKFLVSFDRAFADSGARQLWKMPVYIDFCFRLLLGFGIVFQLPVILSILVRLGIVRVDTLAKNRPYAIILTFVVAAILTPPDVVSQIALALPLMLLYEVSILFGRWQERKRAKEEALELEAETEEEIPEEIPEDVPGETPEETPEETTGGEQP